MVAQRERRQNIPDYRIEVGGTAYTPGDQLTDITGKVRPRLISLALTDKRGGEADQLDLVLDDSDGKLELPSKGATIRVSLGWKHGAGVRVGLVDKGRFTVDEVEWSGEPDQVSIRARAADLRDGFRIRKAKSWRDTTLGAVVRDIAGANGLEPRIAPDLAAVAVPSLAQHHTSDMQLLRRLGREHDSIATVKNGKLIFSPIGKSATTGGTPLAPLVITRNMGSKPRLTFVDRGGDAGVEVSWHDKDAGERKTIKVGDGKGKPKRMRRVYHSEDSARAAAQGENSRTKRSGAAFDFSLALGRADLVPDTPVTLRGFKEQADAIGWIAAEVTHTLDRNGFRSNLKLEQKG
jgi:phage protein D